MPARRPRRPSRITSMHTPLSYLGTASDDGLRRAVGNTDVRGRAASVLERLDDDPHKPGLLAALRDADERDTGYWEIRSFLNWFATSFSPRTYLEIGVRRGWSMAQVAAGAPRCDLFGIDLWVEQYAGAPNPGPEFVNGQLARVGYDGKPAFATGDSHELLPLLGRHDPLPDGQRWPASFDLILVDGDHRFAGALADLRDAVLLLAVGGVLVFDDLQYAGDEQHFGCEDESVPTGTLLDAWEQVEADHPQIRFMTNLVDPPGTGIAIRLA